MLIPTDPQPLLRSPLISLTSVCPRALTYKAPWCQNVCSCKIKDPQGKNPLLTEIKMGWVIRKISYMSQNSCSSEKCFELYPQYKHQALGLKHSTCQKESSAGPGHIPPALQKDLICLEHSKCLINNLWNKWVNDMIRNESHKYSKIVKSRRSSEKWKIKNRVLP